MKHKDLYNYFGNEKEWEQQFLCKDVLERNWEKCSIEPLPRVFVMKLFNKEFCMKIREEAEFCNKWNVKNKTSDYTTTDIYLDTICSELNDIYDEILSKYVFPLLSHFWAYEINYFRSNNFVAKYDYKEGQQISLRYHDDKSSISCLLTLSSLDEYKGGGTHFLADNCILKNDIGYITIHPGEITHRHCGVKITEGKRYILVSFVENYQFDDDNNLVYTN